jgi:nitroreductase
VADAGRGRQSSGIRDTGPIDHVLTTTRAVRKRLDFSRPVPRALVEECLAIAVQAPTGGNRQGWHFIFVEDPGQKRAIAVHYGRRYDVYSRGPAPQFGEGDVRTQRMPRVRDSSTYLRERMHEVPILLIPCIEARLPDGASTEMQAGLYGSILPAVWSFMLAARARGLGTALTTLHLRYEREVAGVLGPGQAEGSQNRRAAAAKHAYLIQWLGEWSQRPPAGRWTSSSRESKPAATAARLRMWMGEAKTR